MTVLDQFSDVLGRGRSGGARNQQDEIMPQDWQDRESRLRLLAEKFVRDEPLVLDGHWRYALLGSRERGNTDPNSNFARIEPILVAALEHREEGIFWHKDCLRRGWQATWLIRLDGPERECALLLPKEEGLRAWKHVADWQVFDISWAHPNN